MSVFTRSGRPALEQKCKGPGHWHIEGWCAFKEGIWMATNGPCYYAELH
jgi:hypothetical protein